MNIEVAQSFYQEYFEYLPKGFDDIYLFLANSGEIYCFLAYLAKACIKKTNSKNPLFVAGKPYHKDIINMFFPGSRYAYFDIYLKEERLNSLPDFWEFDGHKHFQIFSGRHFSSVNSNLGTVHYFDEMLKTLNIPREEVSIITPVIKPEYEAKSLEKAKSIGLKLEKFVIISPEALTTKPMPDSFWINLTKKLYLNGYDVFLNKTKPSNITAKHCDMKFSELYALARISKGIVSLRSGISEFLSQCGAKNIAVCPRFHWSPVLTAKQCLDAYTIMKLPFIDKNLNFELNPDLYETENELIDNIVQLINEK